MTECRYEGTSLLAAVVEGTSRLRAEKSHVASMTIDGPKRRVSVTVTTSNSSELRSLLAGDGLTGNTMYDNARAGCLLGKCMVTFEKYANGAQIFAESTRIFTVEIWIVKTNDWLHPMVHLHEYSTQVGGDRSAAGP